MLWKESKTVLNNQNPSVRLSICFWHCFFCILFLITWRWFQSTHLHQVILMPLMCLLALEFLQDPYLDTLHPPPFFFFILPYPESHDFLDWLCCKSCKSCTTSGHSFLQQEFTVWGLTVFTAFPITTANFNHVILPDFHDVLSGFPFHSTDNLSIDYHV